MENIEDLLKIGIKPTEELNTVERTEIIKKLSLLMSKNISTLAYNEKENYMRLFNIRISYADFDFRLLDEQMLTDFGEEFVCQMGIYPQLSDKIVYLHQQHHENNLLLKRKEKIK